MCFLLITTVAYLVFCVCALVQDTECLKTLSTHKVVLQYVTLLGLSN